MTFRIFSEVLQVEQSLPQQVIDWGVQIVQAPKLWSVTKGEGIKVAVLDTGIDYRHPDLSPNFKGGINFTTTNPDNCLDRQGHGTHVAGIIAGCDNNIGIVGVAPKAELYAVKVLGDNGEGSIASLVQGIDYAIRQGVDIISMSLGMSQDPGPQVHEAIKRAREAGIIMVAAAGNEASQCSYPAAYDEVIAVGAIDEALDAASFSNFGPQIDVAAPGVNILSTYLNGTYARLSGTSMATPIVTGVIALIQSFARKQGFRATPEKILELIQQRSVDLGTSGADEHFGNGLINVYKMVKQYNLNPR